jgi:polyisoprenoid-binding protein YceI
MKKILTIIFLFLFVGISNGQERFLTKNGKISFFSKATLEDISAENNQVASIIDTNKGAMAIAILIKSFLFEKALMEEHFNENYLESDKFPKATFKGLIQNFNTLEDVKSERTVKGKLTIHGVTKEKEITAFFTKTQEGILVEGDFMVNLADFKIKIPSVVAKNIAKNIKVTFNFNHKPYKK